ncbi:hypothetical protein CDAR_111231 [Caerostris darwini]|uniref:Uncharacterized protein n=1 Tax=Caerostris darwini TaxID=1538125 RepID=A0AAV4STM5_9ARAC|nr:hypothetical protein CDAR_111231 [Caerostris darwini]
MAPLSKRKTVFTNTAVAAAFTDTETTFSQVRRLLQREEINITQRCKKSIFQELRSEEKSSSKKEEKSSSKVEEVSSRSKEQFSRSIFQEVIFMKVSSRNLEVKKNLPRRKTKILPGRKQKNLLEVKKNFPRSVFLEGIIL